MSKEKTEFYDRIIEKYFSNGVLAIKEDVESIPLKDADFFWSYISQRIPYRNDLIVIYSLLDF